MRPAAVLGIIILSLLRAQAQALLPVIPGGEGFGMQTRAAYACGTNPAILRVTALTDAGPGSLRAALLDSRPRVVLFETSGTIVLTADIDIKTPCLTLAGQTAPSPGITLRGGGLNLYAPHVLIQHIRIRPGDGGPVLPQTADHDASIVYGLDPWWPHDIVYDHVSFSWGGGKNVIVAANTQQANVTFWRCIFSEALYYAKNVIVSPGQPSSLGMLIGESGGVSIQGSLFAHNMDRNPEIQENSTVVFLNNAIFDWGKDQTAYTVASFFYDGPGPITASFAGNVYISTAGPYPHSPLYAIGTWPNIDTRSRIYIADTTIDPRLEPVIPFEKFGGPDQRVLTSPIPLTGYTLLPSASVEAFVLEHAGARPHDRDPVDARIVNDVQQRISRRVRSQDEVGGWPPLAVNIKPITVPANPHAVTASGYTVLEVWLQGHAVIVESGGAGWSQMAAPTGVQVVQ